MRRRPSRRARLLALTAVGLLVVPAFAALPARAAQSSLEVQAAQPGPIEPGASRTLTVTIVYEYEGSSTESSDGDVRISVSASVPAQDQGAFSATISPGRRTVPVDDDAQRATARFDLEISVAGDATAFRQGTVTVLAEAGRSGDVAGSSTQLQIVPVVAYVPGFALSPTQEAFALSTGINRVQVRAVNQANGPVEAQLEIIQEPVGVQVASPPRRTIGHGAGQNATTFDLTVVREEGQSAADRTIVLRARYWAQGRTDTQQLTGEVVVTLRDAFDVPLVAVAVIGAAAALGGAVYWFKVR